MLFKKGAQIQTPPAGGEYVSIVTYLPLRGWRYLIPFMRMSGRVEKQLKQSTGAISYGMAADLFGKRFYTLTVWQDRRAMGEFVRAEPHAEAIRRFEEWAGEGASFAEWQTSDPRANWNEAMERLKSPTFYYKRPAA
ncbi:MAG: DUF3291 domain-containing protein [Chloroflexi bacterium]|nr:DUF3291 domain-containing protein [Chloroflexota bacterium]